MLLFLQQFWLFIVKIISIDFLSILIIFKMSSLVTSASTWTNDDSAPKKRQSTMNKTIKIRPEIQGVGEISSYDNEQNNLKKLQPSSIEDHNNSMEQRNSRVNELLNNMTSANAEPDNKMGNFSPLAHPNVNVKKDFDDNNEVKKYSYALPSFNESKSTGNYGMNTGSTNLSNYQTSYEPPQQLVNKPYYANMGMGPANTSASGNENKLMEKMNYLIRLMEEQGHEKTNNITEEFILYTFLGVFIIFVVDSFSKVGRYTR